MNLVFATLFLQFSDCKIRSNSKRPHLDAIFKYVVKISATDITFGDIERLPLGNHRFPVRVRLLPRCRSELSAKVPVKRVEVVVGS